jgi:hypothetical protein
MERTVTLREAVDFVTFLLDTRSARMGEFVTIEAAGNRYVQFAFGPDSVYAESVGNAYLEDPWRLSDAEQRMLATLGWEGPVEGGDAPHGNYTQQWSLETATKVVVDCLFMTLVAVHLRGEGDTLTIVSGHFGGDGGEEADAEGMAA